MMRRILATYLLLLCFAAAASAQADRQHIRQGNRLYHRQDFEGAEVSYNKAAQANSANAQALYNYGCALMQQEKDSAAIVHFQTAGQMETNKLRKAKSYHNIGVICQSHQMFAEAIDAYKESLRNNPKDDETRYNLALCQRQLKEQENNQDQNQQNQDQQQDQQQDQNQQQQQQDQQQQQQDQQQEQPQEQMSRENAEQLLQAAMRDEQEIQDKMQKQQTQPQNRRLQKNW